MTKLRPLGATGLDIAPLILGGNVFGSNDMDRDRSFAVLDAFVAHGGTMIDTADIYANYLPGGQGGESETMIGDWMAARGNRASVQIATKIGNRMADDRKGLSARWIEQGVEDSLRRLRTDHIDLYFAHRDDLTTPLAETAEAFDRLVRAGKVRSLGASNFAPARLAEAIDGARANGWTPYQALQPLYNLLERGFESDFLPLVQERGLGVTVYFGLAQGYLAGKYRSKADLGKSWRGEGITGYMEGKGPAVLAAMDAIATERSIGLPAIAMAWLMAKPGVTAPIASATRPTQVEELMQALDITLTDAEMALLDAAG